MLKAHTRFLDNTIYPKKAVADARMAYRSYCDFAIDTTGSLLPQLMVTVKSKYQDNSHQIILEFWNYLLDLACQIKTEE
ncbi:MAG: HxsD-like protein [Desulfobulbus sp.]|nr:HxsD-like protein [Desulfobulbus sp.]